MDFVKNLFKGDKTIWGIYFILIFVSAIEMFSATSTLAYRASEYYNPAFSHITHLIFGTIIVIIVHNIKAYWFRNLSYIVYPLSIVLLIAVMFLAPEVNGASRHLYGFQPSEVAKFAIISVTCTLLAKGLSSQGHTKQNFFRILILAAIPLLLIAVENLSTALLIGLVVFCLMFVSHVPMRWLLSLVGIGIVLAAFGIATLFLLNKDNLKGRTLTWRNRIEQSFMAHEATVDQPINDKNMQVQYGHMAIANGGLTGKFFGNSQMRDYLPQAYSDYIYAIIIEETGLLFGGIVVMVLYFALLLRSSVIFRRCTESYPGLMLLGVSMLIAFQAVINMSVGVDLIPVTGQPMPLISRGGSSIFMTCIFFGIILSVSRRSELEEEINDSLQEGETNDTEPALIATSSEEPEYVLEEKEENVKEEEVDTKYPY